MTIFNQNTRKAGLLRMFSTIAALALLVITPAAQAAIDGVTGDTFNLTAGAGYISIADGGSVYSWGYSANGEAMQLPGPTLIVNQNDIVTVTLHNGLPAAAGNVSIVFPGHVVTSDGGEPGLLTAEAATGGSVTYTFTADKPGTYQYHSGTRPDLQVEMGLYGAIIVRPATAGCAYNQADTCFDREHLFLLSEIDIDIHRAAEAQVSGPGPIDIGTGSYHSEYWMINGRAAPDTMAAAGRAELPHQPYNIMPRMHPGEKLLLRVVGAGREMHPFHTHGNHARLLARDGRPLLTEGGSLAGPLLFTIPSVPGGTADAIFEWTGQDLGWDIYGSDITHAHLCNGKAFDEAQDTDPVAPEFDPVTHEYCADHGKAIPVTLPSLSSLGFGGFYSGSPYLGGMGSLPPGEGGLNPNAGFSYMWHSHTEREMVNNDVFPGGMMTMLIVEASDVPID